jgi:hypothetical protein
MTAEDIKRSLDKLDLPAVLALQSLLAQQAIKLYKAKL